MFVTLTMKAPNSADQKDSTRNPSTSSPTSQKRVALMSTMPTPIVSTMNGSANSISTGLITVLRKLNSTTTMISVDNSLHSIPGTSFVATVTPSAIMLQRNRSWKSG